MTGSQQLDPTDTPPSGYTIAPAGRDVGIAVLCFAAFQFALQVGIPLVYIASDNTDLSDPHKVSLYFIVTLAELVALFALAYYFACRKYADTLQDGLLLHPVPALRYIWSAVAAGVMVAFDLAVTPYFEQVPDNPVWGMSPPFGALVFSVLLLIQPPVFAVFYQGFIFGRFRPLGEARAFIAAVSVFAAHSWLGRGPVTQMISPAIFATILTFQTSRSNSIAPAIATLYIHRLVMVVILVASLFSGTGIP